VPERFSFLGDIDKAAAQVGKINKMYSHKKLNIAFIEMNNGTQVPYCNHSLAITAIFKGNASMVSPRRRKTLENME
jgi:hypothetical protein